MAKYIKTPFAENGDLTSIPDDAVIDGSVSYDAGWGYKYELDPATDVNAKRLERQKHNQVFNDVTSNIKEWQEQTFPDWIADAGSGTPFAYSKGVVVTYTDSKQYVSLIDNNTQVPTGTNWLEVDLSNFVDKTTNQTIAGTKTFSSTINGNISGNAGTATKLTTARTLTISGDASGSTTFDGSANKTISINVLDSEKIGGIPAFQATGASAGSTTQDPNITTDEYIITNHVNSPNSATYWHIRTQFAIIKGLVNRGQIAIQYNDGISLYVRNNYVGVWTDWEKMIGESDSQALHPTDALRLVGDTLSLYKGDGTSESVSIPDFDLSHSFLENGYQKFSNGLIIQWGATAAIDQNLTTTTTFPITFPNMCFIVSGISNRHVTSAASESAVISKTNSNFVFQAGSGGGGQPRGINYIAIGY